MTCDISIFVLIHAWFFLALNYYDGILINNRFIGENFNLWPCLLIYKDLVLVMIFASWNDMGVMLTFLHFILLIFFNEMEFPMQRRC